MADRFEVKVVLFMKLNGGEDVKLAVGGGHMEAIGNSKITSDDIRESITKAIAVSYKSVTDAGAERELELMAKLRGETPETSTSALSVPAEERS